MAFMGTEKVSRGEWLYLREAQTTLGLFYHGYRRHQIIRGIISTRGKLQEGLTFQF